MTDEEARSLKPGDRVLYNGEIWTFKHYKKTNAFGGNQVLLSKLQRGNAIFHTATSERMMFYDNGKNFNTKRK